MRLFDRSPSGSGNVNGKTTSREFSDTTGRLVKNKIDNTGAYTRYDYANTGNAVTSYSTIIDVNNDTYINTSDEVATESVFDGAGRLLKTRTANPNSTGGYTGKKVEYDILGRAFRETVPTEMNSSWNPAGDDYRSNSWLWNTREFDWKGRVTRTIPSDSTGSDGKDTLMSYEGCGCAGGMITTIQGPVTTAKDVGGTLQTTKRRVQKVYADILGRTAKTEVWDLDGAGSTPYSTTVTTFNGRDQATLVREYSGGTSSGTYQDTTMSYDGHGRLKELHKPEWFDGSTLKYTTTTYNADDTPATVTDPRGTVTSYSYGNTTIAEKRAVLLGISYTVPNGSGIPVPGNVAFEYDAAGNRSKMTDDTGELTYAYDELSRLKTETKDFADTLSQSTYALSYQYTLTGSLKTITDPFSDSITYAHDAVGRTTGVTGSSFAGITSYASAVNYRAFGPAKSMIIETATDTTITQNFDNALRLTDYTAVSTANSGDTINKDYTYANDGSLLQAEDDRHSIYSQTYSYDFAGRVVNNRIGELSGTEKYKQAVGYDAFGNITSRSTWNDGTSGPSYTAGFTNNRKSSGGFQSSVDTFDVGGNITQNQIYGGMTNKRKWTFDAAGRVSNWMETLPQAGTYLYDQGADTTYDGDGRPVKKIEKNRLYNNENAGYVTETKYRIYSSVTGSEITELNGSGDKVKTSVYLHGEVIAEQINLSTDIVTFKFGDPIVGTQDATDSAGVITPNDADLVQHEPLGAYIPVTEADLTGMPNYRKGTSVSNPEFACAVDGYIDPDCGLFNAHLRSGSGDIGPLGRIAAWQQREYPDGKKKWYPVFWERGKNGEFRYWGIDYGRVDVYDDETQKWDRGDWGKTGEGWIYFYDQSAMDAFFANRFGDGVEGDVCDIRDLFIPKGVSLVDNIRTAERRLAAALGAGILFAGPGTLIAATNHALWFYSKVDYGADWDYKTRDTNPYKSIYEEFGNFHFGMVGAAAGFDRGNTLYRMAGRQQEANGGPNDGGEHGGLSSIMLDFVLGINGGQRPYKDEWADQRMIRRGAAFYKARCHLRPRSR